MFRFPRPPLVLLIAPDLLSNVWIGLVVLIAAVIVTGALVRAERAFRSHASP